MTEFFWATLEASAAEVTPPEKCDDSESSAANARRRRLRTAAYAA
jgi:hypothetical protein